MGSGISMGLGIRGVPLFWAVKEIWAFVMLLAIVVADRITAKDPDRRAPYAIAVVVGAIFAVVLPVPLVRWTLPSLGVPAGPVSPFSLFYPFFEVVIFSGAVVSVMLDRRRVDRARARMQAAELERIDAERRSIESDLQAMQARVEPKFLFNTLAHVQELYDRDPARGEQMLDDLIAYLRAAMPRIRDASSTVGQELELARAYLDIVKMRLGDELRYAIEAPPDLVDARLPPMTLLPLVDHAIGGPAPEVGSRTLEIAAESAAGARLQVMIRDSDNAFAPETAVDGIDALRERLEALYGDKANIRLARDAAGATEAVVAIPLERELGKS